MGLMVCGVGLYVLADLWYLVVYRVGLHVLGRPVLSSGLWGRTPYTERPVLASSIARQVWSRR